mmetsp:Transcript_101923/g.297221  ORF Transcript_101923/g.297221 Transcript_101923/m.297221 type:complete len:266 (-) Transcript_101923:1014-1811(-)
MHICGAALSRDVFTTTFSSVFTRSGLPRPFPSCGVQLLALQATARSRSCSSLPELSGGSVQPRTACAGTARELWMPSMTRQNLCCELSSTWDCITERRVDEPAGGGSSAASAGRPKPTSWRETVLGLPVEGIAAATMSAFSVEDHGLGRRADCSSACSWTYSRSSAAAPAAKPQLCEVPLMRRKAQPSAAAADAMLSPGSTISGFMRPPASGPKLLYGALLSGEISRATAGKVASRPAASSLAAWPWPTNTAGMLKSSVGPDEPS